MKDRQRWQPEEDALLRAYVSQHGPKEWSLLPQRMGLSFHRDPKSCQERWKNYLRPGLRKGSLTGEEQSLVISLQAKHGNKWKLIASHLPGRTPKKLGKWWEVFKQKQIKIDQNNNSSRGETGSNSDSVLRSEKGEYDHILETFADKHVVKKNKEMVLGNGGGSGGGDDGCAHHPVLSLAPVGSSSTSSSACNVTSAHGADMAYSHLNHHHGNHRPPVLPQVIPAWMSSTPSTSLPSTLCSMSPALTGSSPPSVSLSLSPSNPRPQLEIATAGRSSSSVGFQQASILVQLCRDLEEGRQSWMQHKKEANWRLSRLEQQLELEKARKKREKEEEIEAKIRALREEENSFLHRIDAECRDQLCAIQRDADAKEAKMIEIWDARHTKLARLVDQFGCSTTGGGARRQHHPSHPHHHHHYQFGNHEDMH